MTIPKITLQNAWEIMNKVDEKGMPVPFEVVGNAITEKLGKVVKLKNVIMLRNESLMSSPNPNRKPADDERIYEQMWKFYALDTYEIKSLSHYHITHLNGMEVGV